MSLQTHYFFIVVGGVGKKARGGAILRCPSHFCPAPRVHHQTGAGLSRQARENTRERPR